MPRREGETLRLEALAVPDRLAQHGRFQEHWYRLAATWAVGLEVLDVGAADGYGMDILRAAGATRVAGIDPLPLRDDVRPTPLAAIADRAYDLVVACDVIEHVEDDTDFLAHLLRVSRRYVFLSTPNWNVSRAANPFHVREYTPVELLALLGGRAAQFFTSDAHLRVAPRAALAANESAPNFGVQLDLAGFVGADSRP